MNTTNMNTNLNDTTKNVAAKGKEISTNFANSVKEVNAKFNLGGISIPEVAILGAAGYVLWKNRSKIAKLLETNGIEVPVLLNGDFSEVVQSGISLLGNKKDQAQNQSSMKEQSGKDQSSTPTAQPKDNFANKASNKTGSGSQEFHS
jgi:hypothetical protein